MNLHEYGIILNHFDDFLILSFDPFACSRFQERVSPEENKRLRHAAKTSKKLDCRLECSLECNTIQYNIPNIPPPPTHLMLGVGGMGGWWWKDIGDIVLYCIAFQTAFQP